MLLKKMTLHQFFKKLDEFYNKGVNGSKILCKFYLQQSTFSYELHDSDKRCFTLNSIIHESKVFWWGYKDDNLRDIITDIEETAKSLKL